MAKMLWEEKPAENWHEAFPLGNGFMGAMVYGKYDTEKISFNEDTIWYGGKIDRNNPSSYPALEKIRNLLFAEKHEEAEPLILGAMSGIPDNQRHYEPAGDLLIEFPAGVVSNYHRQLDFTSGLTEISYQQNQTLFARKSFISYPDQVFALHLTAKGLEKLQFRCRFIRGRGLVDKVTLESNRVLIDASSSQAGVTFQVGFTLVSDGKVESLGEFLQVKDATKATVYLTIATNYRDNEYDKTVKNRLDEAVKKGFATLEKRHLKDYQPLFKKMDFHLAKNETVEIPTSEKLTVFKENKKYGNDLIETLFHYGRYLLLASSRKGSMAANLQGIWNDSFQPPWDSKYTININTEMNYWLAEKANLSDCHEPLFQLLEKMYPNGKVTAKKMYHARGFMAHHNTDIWGDTAPQTYSLTGTIWPTGGAWLLLDIYQHYLYTKDQEFLKRYFYLIEEGTLFFVDYLILSKEGYYVTSPSCSPENKFYNEHHRISSMTYGPTMDNQILRDLFHAYLDSCRILQKGNYQKEVQERLDHLPPTMINGNGYIQEWIKDYQEVDLGHRHLSHLYGLYPSEQITLKTPELFKAAKKTLIRRLENGGGYTGWSCAWIINLWCQLLAGDEVEKNMHRFLKQSLYPNLFDSHPPFQIDGNFGFTNGILEAIIQKKAGTLYLLPALPPSFQSGEISGICLSNRQEVSLAFSKGQLVSLEGKGDFSDIQEIYYHKRYYEVTEFLKEDSENRKLKLR